MSTSEDKTLKREDELTDISKIAAVQRGEYAPEKPSLFSKLKEGVHGISSKITHKTDEVKENIAPHREEHKSLFTKLNDGLSSIASGISHTLHKNTESTETAPELPSELKSEESVPKTLAHKISDTFDELKEDGNLTTPTTITPNREGPSTLDKIDEKYGEITDKIVESFEQVKDKILPASLTEGEKTKTETETETKTDSTIREDSSVVSKSSEPLSKLIETPLHKVSPTELSDFVEVKTGFKETVNDFMHERRFEELGGKKELISSNPFGSLNQGVQSVEELPRTIGGDITNKTLENESTETEKKSLTQVVKGGFTDANSTLSHKLGSVVDKAIDTLQTPVDKENFTQIA